MSLSPKEANLRKYKAWENERQEFNDWNNYIRGDKLNRKLISDECGFGRAAIYQNPAISTAIDELEKDLLSKGVLREKVILDKEKHDKVQAKRHATRDRKLNEQETEIELLRSENAKLKRDLDKALIQKERLINTGILVDG